MVTFHGVLHGFCSNICMGPEILGLGMVQELAGIVAIDAACL